MIRSCRIHQCFPPIAWADDRKENDTERLYRHYLEQDGLSRDSFLAFCRANQLVNGLSKPWLHLDKTPVAIGIRYGSEMRDMFVGQLATMHMPHATREQLQGIGEEVSGFDYVQCLIGFVAYLMSLAYNGDGTVRLGSTEFYAPVAAYMVEFRYASRAALSLASGKMHSYTLSNWHVRTWSVDL